ncbi:MAG: glycosyltransferase family 4 protein [Bacteroidota bacterium]
MAGKKILILCNKFPYPTTDGGTIAMMNMIKGFYREGVEVTVMAMNTYKHSVELEDLPEHIQQMAQYVAVDVDIRLKLFPMGWNLLAEETPYHTRRFTSKSFRQEVQELVELHEYDLVQLEGLYLTEYIKTIKAAAASRPHPKPLPVVLRAHNIEHEIWKRQADQTTNSLRKYYFNTTANRIKAYQEQHLRNKNYDAVVPITKRDATELKKMGANVPVHVCPAGIDTDRLQGYSDGNKQIRSLFYIGALDWMPNIEGLKWFLKHVWPRLNDTFPDVKLHIAGRNMDPFFEDAESESVVVHGEVPDAFEFMSANGIMLVPLFSGSGMRVKIIEGMALAKPIVATSIAAEGIPAQHGDHLLIADDPDAYFNCVATLLEEPNQAIAMGKHGKSFVLKQFDNQAQIQDLLGFYEKEFWGK